MLVGTVVGQVWATRKEGTLEGLRLLVVEPYVRGARGLQEERGAGEGKGAETIVAVDPLGADVGERVLVVFGRAARHAIGRGQDIGFQTAVVGIVDGMELAGGERVGQTAAEDVPPGRPAPTERAGPTARTEEDRAGEETTPGEA